MLTTIHQIAIKQCIYVLEGEVLFRMNIKEQALKLEKNGIILSSDVTKAGIHRSVLTSLVDDGLIVKCSRGVYILSDELEDEYYLLQHKFNRGIFSHSTALYLHGFSDRVPLIFHMTFPAGYNNPAFEKENIVVTRVCDDNYTLGMSTTNTPYGNEVKVYDVERCLCDVLRGQGDDLQTTQMAYRKYFASKERDINKLIRYAKQLRVEPKVRNYVEVLL